ncbi:MAG: transglycosylase SLT domain-containing protein [gamma proteobacterium symbiont of Bathyaustriella thionipta]|nr:transglycosylase SLT domain-containing protein [gamma proteobacterium symbiont of Bathyaustriella thionipta]
MRLLSVFAESSLARLSLCGLLLCISFAVQANRPDDSLQQQRLLFQQASKDLSQGKLSAFNKKRAQLQNYSIAPYLDYYRLSRNLRQVKSRDIQQFLQQYADWPIAPRLRYRWLKTLAKQERWNEFLNFYAGSNNTALQCHYLNALLHNGQAEKVWPQVKSIWLYGKSRPKACDPVLQKWKPAHLTNQLVWQRFALAMHSQQISLAKYLRKSLPQSQQARADLWLRLYRQPEIITESWHFAADNPMRHEMLLYGLDRMARKSPIEAHVVWQQLKQQYHFDSEQSRQADSILQQASFRMDYPQNLAYLDQAEPAADDIKFHERRIRAALQEMDWEKVLKWIAAMPAEAQNKTRWRYWKGRALFAQGDKAEGLAVLREVAKDRSYYGFMAADRCGRPYQLSNLPLTVEKEKMQRLATDKALIRARELYYTNNPIDARREWRVATEKMGRDEKQAAALLAQQWGWLDRAILTLAQTDYWDDLELRFPIKYRHTVEQYAAHNNLSAAWVFGLMRQESVFMQDIQSHAGAVGLMQLMPKTAQQVSRKLHEPWKGKASLKQSKTNIRYGSSYMRQMLDLFEHNPMLATAAYNVGPHRVKRWLNEKNVPADIWVESIPFKETRTYVRRVMAYTIIYEKLLGQSSSSISLLLTPALPSTVAGRSVSRSQAHSGEG